MARFGEAEAATYARRNRLRQRQRATARATATARAAVAGWAGDLRRARCNRRNHFDYSTRLDYLPSTRCVSRSSSRRRPRVAVRNGRATGGAGRWRRPVHVRRVLAFVVDVDVRLIGSTRGRRLVVVGLQRALLDLVLTVARLRGGADVDEGDRGAHGVRVGARIFAAPSRKDFDTLDFAVPDKIANAKREQKGTYCVSETRFCAVMRASGALFCVCILNVFFSSRSRSPFWR